jgi:hypothetical protein
MNPGDGDTVQKANDVAAAAALAWIAAIGLATEIDDLRLQEEDRLVPAPGLRVIWDSVVTAAHNAADAAERFSRLLSSGTSAAVRAAAMSDARAAQATAELGLRRLAQLGFGVSAQSLGGDRIELLDRTCVAVLHPPDRTRAWSG